MYRQICCEAILRNIFSIYKVSHAQHVNYSDFHKNGVCYNSNTTNEAKSKNVII